MEIEKGSNSELGKKASIVLNEIYQYTDIKKDEDYSGKKKVFVSYNHQDSHYAELIKRELEKAKIDVTIDIEELRYGDTLKDFIDKSIKDTDYTICIISENSLLSPWVILESLETMMHEHIHERKKFIPVFIDNSLFDNRFHLDAIKKIEKGIQELIVIITEQSNRFLPTTSLDDKKQRLMELRNNFDKIIKKVTETLSADFTTEAKIKMNIPKLIKLIKDD